MENKELLQYLAAGIILYFVLNYLAGDKKEGMCCGGLSSYWNRPGYAYPATYPGYYKYWNLDVLSDADRCIPVKADTSCVNKRLMKTGGDVNESIKICQGRTSPQQYVGKANNVTRRLLMTDYPESMHIMPTTIPTVSQEVPTYEALWNRRY